MNRSAAATNRLQSRFAHLQSRLRGSRLGQSRLYRRYGWAIAPLLVITALQINAHLYFDLRNSYDFTPHWNNVVWLLQSGEMPPPPPGPYNYEAGQAPIFYQITAAVMRAANALFGPQFDGFFGLVPLLLLALGLLWAGLMAVFIQMALRRAPGWLRALALSVVMLLPVNVELSVMFTNDPPVMIFLTWGTLALWAMGRSGQTRRLKRWLWAALLIGLATLFKNNGLILIVVYGALAYLLMIHYVLRREIRAGDRVALGAFLGLPLMLVPLATNAAHMRRYTADLIHGPVEKRSMWGNYPLTFFTTFDTSIFENPFAFGPGERSYWSLQYVTLHNDYFNHWNSDQWWDLPPEQVRDVKHRQPVPLYRFEDGVRLMYLGLPVTALMLLGVAASAWRTLRRPRAALRDGSAVIALVTAAAQAAQLWRFSEYAYTNNAVIHARYFSFVFMFLLVTGLAWYWRCWGRRDHWLAHSANLLLAAALLAYSVTALRMFWLPPL